MWYLPKPERDQFRQVVGACVNAILKATPVPTTAVVIDPAVLGGLIDGLRSQLNRILAGPRYPRYAWFKALTAQTQHARLEQELGVLLRTLFSQVEQIEVRAAGIDALHCVVTPYYHTQPQCSVLVKFGFADQVVDQLDTYTQWVRYTLRARLAHDPCPYGALGRSRLRFPHSYPGVASANRRSRGSVCLVPAHGGAPAHA